MNTSKNYNWYSWIQDRAIYEFEVDNGIYNEKQGPAHYYILSFIVEICTNKRKSKNLVRKTINGQDFFYMSSSFIMKNLKLFKAKKRTLVRDLEDLDKLGYIDRIVMNKNQRYMRISDEFKYYISHHNNKASHDPQFKEIHRRIAKQFSLTSNNQKQSITNFLITIEDIEYFHEQLNGYIKFKEYTNEIVHNFPRYIEVWDSKNWNLDLDKRKHKDQMERFDN